MPIVLGFCLLMVLAGCSERHAPAAKNDAGKTASNAPVTAGSQTPPSSNQPPSSNNASTPGANNAAENPLTAARNRKIEAMRQSGRDPAAPKTDIETLLKRSTRPAPENSEFAAVLTNVVVERRTFLKHPILSKVEKVTDGPRSTIKLLTTDGRTIDLPGNAIEKLSIASSASILRAAGLQMPQSQPADKKPGAANRN